MGICGRSCNGVEGVDSVGVYEFDTVSQTVVATHVLKEGIGGEPYISFDGSKYSEMQIISALALIFF